MKVVQIYKCFADELRLRILNLLMPGPLCVCHLVEILECDQVKMSKQLRYMKELGILEGDRHAQWIIYRLADPDDQIVVNNIKSLGDYAEVEHVLAEDLRKRGEILDRLRSEPSPCADALLIDQRPCCLHKTVTSS